ncbi:MAG: hypothetical protein QOE70_3015 [Chthoniobacter sp.]|nr:hypothetical protein [Chthoniobacter sp.]
MALRARLVRALGEPEPSSSYHAESWTALSTLFMRRGDRRLEAENYLSSGYGIRISIESKSSGWVRFEKLARVWQPLRLKGIQVGPETGTPFFAATQVFDLRPVPRKWLALGRTHNAEGRFIERGQILVTCSGAVGRATLAFAPHAKVLISHDLLRIEARQLDNYGWLYAYLRAPKVRSMMTGAQYGHIIKHLEVAHIGALPIPEVPARWRAHFATRVREILDLRDGAHAATLEAETLFEQSLGRFKQGDNGETGFEVKARKAIFPGRRRFEAAAHRPHVAQILKHFSRSGERIELLRDVAERVWWMNRFKRVYGDGGTRYLSADELFTTNPEITKRILISDARKAKPYFVKAGWLLMACSGQTYGLLGSTRLVSKYDEDAFLSHDLLRIAPRGDGARSGYLLTALTHPILGRPLVIARAYGTSIPHLDPGDIELCPIVRLSLATENAIADLAERSAELRARADLLETEIAIKAEALLDRFIAGENLSRDNDEPFLRVAEDSPHPP